MDQEELKLEEFENWNLFLSEKQYPYIGRSLAVTKRKERNAYFGMNKTERNELFDRVIPHWDRIISSTFGIPIPEISIRRNDDHHTRAHLIPRYSFSILFDGIRYQDPNPGKSYSPYPPMQASESGLITIRDHFLESFEKKSNLL